MELNCQLCRYAAGLSRLRLLVNWQAILAETRLPLEQKVYDRFQSRRNRLRVANGATFLELNEVVLCPDIIFKYMDPL